MKQQYTYCYNAIVPIARVISNSQLMKIDTNSNA